MRSAESNERGSSAVGFKMKVILTSDFPSDGNEEVFSYLKTLNDDPRIAWIPPFTDTSRERFLNAREIFKSHGFHHLAYCDIDQEVDPAQLEKLTGYDMVYLTGGDPLVFRRNILRSGLSDYLREFLQNDGVLVAASGGSMQLTKNLSLFRLHAASLEETLAARDELEALAIVDYELLPHYNRFGEDFIRKVRQYSGHVEHEIVALNDGAALIHTSRSEYHCLGEMIRFSHGKTLR